MPCYSSLGVVYIMGHELVLGPLWFISRGENVRVTMQLEVPKRHISCLHYPLSWASGLCCESYKRGPLVAKVKGTWQRNAYFVCLFVSFICLYLFVLWFLFFIFTRSNISFSFSFLVPSDIVTKRKEGKKGER